MVAGETRHPRLRERRRKRRGWMAREDGVGRRKVVVEEWCGRVGQVIEVAVEERARHGSGQRRWRGPGLEAMLRARRSLEACGEEWGEVARSVPGGGEAAARLFETLRGGGSVRSWQVREGVEEWRHSRVEELGRAVQVAREVAVELGKRGEGPGGEGRPAAMLRRFVAWLEDQSGPGS